MRLETLAAHWQSLSWLLVDAVGHLQTRRGWKQHWPVPCDCERCWRCYGQEQEVQQWKLKQVCSTALCPV